MIDHEKDLYQEALRVIDAKGPFGILYGPARLRGVEGLDALLTRSWEQRRESPRAMVTLARAATTIADSLSSRRLGAQDIWDHRCRAWGELANAQRVANDYERSTESLAEALRHLVRGSRSEELEVRLMDIHASLEGHRCHFYEAFDILDVIAGIRLKSGDRHLAGRSLVKKGMFKGYHGESGEALELTRQGLELLEESRDPILYLQAIHNEVYLLVDLERYAEARLLLWSNLGRYERHGGTIDRLKLRGLWGLINAGLGKLDEAARDFEAERRGLQEEGLSYTAAVTSLDLAAVYFEQGRVTESEAVAFEALTVFQEMDMPEQGQLSVLVLQEMDIPEQGQLSVLVLRKALELRLATVDLLGLLRRTAKFLRRVEHDSTAVFDPTA